MARGNPIYIYNLTWDELVPLFKETWQGVDAAWLVLHPLLPAIGRVCQSLLRRGGRSPRFESPEELCQAVLVLSIGRLTNSEGMTQPANRDAKTPRGFFLNYIKTCALDCLKPLKSDDELPVKQSKTDNISPEQRLDHLASRSELASAQAAPQQRMDADRSLQNVRAAVEDSDVNTRHRVVWICLRVPEWLESHHIHAALDDSVPGEGLVRGAPELLEGMWTWREDVVDPGCRESRKQLAWLLFTSDKTDSEGWARRQPADARRARDRLRQWDGRFHRAHVLPLLTPPEGSP